MSPFAPLCTQACVFHFIEEFCPESEADDNLIINLKTLKWKLDEVIFDWSAAPPPPPPFKHAALEDMLASDPEGMELAREKMLEFWPQLSCARATPDSLPRAPVPHATLVFKHLPASPGRNIAQQNSGANVGRDHSADGLGYGPV